MIILTIFSLAFSMGMTVVQEDVARAINTAYAVTEIRVPADGATLQVRIAGNPLSKNVLVAVNGGPGQDSRYMFGLERLAGPDFKMVTYDQRGTGRSTHISGGYGLLQQVADLEAIREAVKADQIYLFGHSWGGILSMRYTTVHPQKVRSLILMGSGPPAREASLEGQKNLGTRIRELQQKGIIAQAPPEDVSKMIPYILPAYFSDPLFPIPEDLQETGFNAQVNGETIAALGDWDFRRDIAELTHPVLFLWGEDDPFGMPMAEATRTALARASINFVVLEGCGHYWHESPADFFSEVRRFLRLPAENF